VFAVQLSDLVYQPFSYPAKRIGFADGVRRFGAFAVGDAIGRISAHDAVCRHLGICFNAVNISTVPRIIGYSNGFIVCLFGIACVCRSRYFDLKSNFLNFNHIVIKACKSLKSLHAFFNLNQNKSK